LAARVQREGKVSEESTFTPMLKPIFFKKKRKRRRRRKEGF